MKSKNVWGMDSREIQDFGFKYTIYRTTVLIFMILITLVLFYLVDTGVVIVNSVLRLLIILVIVDSIILNLPLRKGKDLYVEAYNFKRKHKKDVVSSMMWYTTTDEIYKYIYRLTKIKPPVNMTTEYYIELINKICVTNKKFPSKFMQNLVLTDEKEATVKIKLIYCEDRSYRKYLIGLEEQSVVLESEVK